MAERLGEATNGLASHGGEPELGTEKVDYDVSERTRSITPGRLGAIIRRIHHVGFQEAIGDSLILVKRHRPYSESNHVLNIALNIL